MGDHINWSEEEFKAYLCLYAAESNFEIHAEEKRLIDSKFSPETIEKIKEETERGSGDTPKAARSGAATG